MSKKIRVRFAPSPTGGLHLGGVRTVLYNYYLLKSMWRFCAADRRYRSVKICSRAEQYIYDCLKWCGLDRMKARYMGGEYGPYRQSERKEIYRGYAEQLIKDGMLIML
jgi:glutamyl-tRNA synthetase